MWGVRSCVRNSTEVDCTVPRLHSPYQAFGNSSTRYRGTYFLHQELQVKNGQVALSSRLQLFQNPPSEAFAGQRDQAVRSLRLWLSTFIPVPRGFWLCPHLPVENELICQAIILVMNQASEQRIGEAQVTCNECGTLVQLERDLHRRSKLKIKMTKNLGAAEDLCRGDGACSNEKLASYLSGRLAHGMLLD